MDLLERLYCDQQLLKISVSCLFRGLLRAPAPWECGYHTRLLLCVLDVKPCECQNRTGCCVFCNTIPYHAMYLQLCVVGSYFQTLKAYFGCLNCRSPRRDILPPRGKFCSRLVTHHHPSFY